MWPFLLQGLVLGGTASAQPGPFQAYLLSQVTRNGWRRTLPASLAPLISDGTVIGLVLIVLTQLPARALSLIEIVGGLFIMFLAWGAGQTFLNGTYEQTAEQTESQNQSVWEAAIMNLLNPNPYLFWSAIGGPILLDGWHISAATAGAFLIGMYSALLGGMILFILFFGFVGALSTRANRILNGISAIILLAFGLWKLWSGVTNF